MTVGRSPAVGSSSPAPLIGGSREPLVTRYDAALLDLDGVLYVGPDAVPGAPEAVAEARASGMRVAFVTNNASRTPEVVAAHLTAVGIAAAARDVVTSAQAAAAVVAAAVAAGSPVLVIGGDGLDAALVEQGLRPVRSLSEAPLAVVQGFSPDVDWRLLAEGTYAVRAGLPWFASNLDATVPTARGLAPGNGALVGVITAATGKRPVAAGKPEAPLHQEAVRRTGARRPIVVGDRLDTDIEGANRAAAPSLLVLTGVTTARDVMLAEPQQRPTFIAWDVWSGLVEPHPPVLGSPLDGFSCGGWVCTSTDGGLCLTGDGAALDGLRAACLATWGAEAPVRADDVQAVVSQLGL